MPGVRSIALLGLLLTSALGFAEDRALRQVIDAEIKKGWQQEKITPAGKSSDAVFLRRVFLDLVGVIPSYEETVAFLKDAEPRRRELLIDKLLGDPRYATQQAHFWDMVLFGRSPQNAEATRKRDGFKSWLAGQFAKNEPYDHIVKNLLSAEQEGSELFYVQYRNAPEEAATAVSRVFLGTQLQCARCHDHPFDHWTQKDFFGMTGFFVRLVVIDGGTGTNKKYRIAEKSTGDVLFAGSVKELKPGMKGDPVAPKFLGGAVLKEPEVPKGFKEPDFKGNAAPPRPLFSRKEKLVQWLASRENAYFARAVSNRIWSQFMGRGFTHPVDDLGNGKNEPTHPALLQVITDDLVQHKFDLKWLIREIVSSEAYQLGDTGPITDAMPKNYERARVRPLTVEEIMPSLRVATGFNPEWAKNTGDYSEYFLRYLGEPNDGQGRFQGSLAEHLFLNNSPMIRQFAQPRKGNLGDTLLTMKGTWEEKVDRLFLSVLSRTPTAPERERFVKHLSSDAKMTSQLVEDAIWVLISCSEFRFNQ